MAKHDTVWGIDVGQCALKALRCRVHDERDDRIVAEAFDYIEYPKILSQPGAEPEELVAEALKQFLSRNNLRGTKVAISVPGQNGLARFIKLPPVEAKKIPDIVRYEARQQIPFDLNDVIWDYQRIGVGAEEEGFALETEIGLFAMKRDAVFRTLEPFQKAGIEVDFVQLTPLSLYNFLLFDQLPDLPTADEYDPDDPPESTVIISLGTDSTDLVISNGFRVWQRSVPLGGNHFTKALTKELKLTFAKAEHLKRNATAAEDPKAVFQAMRPIFGDLLTELQRSIGYFSSIDRRAKIGRVLALGNAIKLPGLRRYLSQSLGYEVERLEEYRALSGSQVLTAPGYKENMLSFGVCYGLAAQALDLGGLRTNLLPQEIVKDRLIRQKKPWALAAAATLLLGCTISFTAHSIALSGVNKDAGWATPESSAQSTISQATNWRSEAEDAQGQFEEIGSVGDNLTSNVDGRILWLEMLRTVNECLPRDNDKRPEDIDERAELHITNLDCQRVEDLAVWYGGVKHWYEAPESEEGAEVAKTTDAADPASAAPTGMVMPESNMLGGMGDEEDTGPAGPTGPGYVIRIQGYHDHNKATAGRNQGAEYVRNTLVANLESEKVILPKVDQDGVEAVSTKELGISYPVLVDPQKVYPITVTNPNAQKDVVARGEARVGLGAGAAAVAKDDEGDVVKLRRFDFVVHFAWQPKTPSERHKEAEEQQEETTEQP